MLVGWRDVGFGNAERISGQVAAGSRQWAAGSKGRKTVRDCREHGAWGMGITECGFEMWDDSYWFRVLDLLAPVVCEKIHKGLPHRGSRTLLMGDQIKMSGEADPTNGDAAKLLKAQILSNGTARQNRDPLPAPEKLLNS